MRVAAACLLVGCVPPSAPQETVWVGPVAPSSGGAALVESTFDAAISAPTRVSGEARIGGVTSSPFAPIADASRVAVGLRPRFRACYETGLTHDPTMAGSLILRATIGPNGDVVSSSTRSSRRAEDTSPRGPEVSADVETCLMRVVRSAVFDPVGGGGSYVDIPITFRRLPD